MKISQHQQRKKERRQHARGIRILQARKERGGCVQVAPRRNNRIAESATRERREAKVKATKAIQESNGKRQDERTKTNERGTRNGTRRTTKRRGGRKKSKEKWEKETENGNGVRAVLC